MVIPAAVATDRRSRLLTAASRVFAREGLDAPVPAIAAEAGVGIGTVYREFCSKEALVAALALERLEWHAGEIHRALDEPDAGAALHGLLWRAAQHQASDHVVGAALAATGDDPEVQAALRRVTRAMGKLIREAQQAGAVGPDITAADVRIMFAALRGVLAEGRDWRRAFELLYAGLTAR
jgi:AcrR family transcriptional regulator